MMTPTNEAELVELLARGMCTESNHAIFDAIKHRGDCTDHAYTCALCEANEYREDARNAVNAMKQANLAVTPREATEEMCRSMNDISAFRHLEKLVAQAAEDLVGEPVESSLVTLKACFDGINNVLAAGNLLGKE